MRIVCVADTHLNEILIPSGDMLIHAGDLCCEGTVEEFELAAEWLGSLSFRHKIAIAGNHDRVVEERPGLARTIFRDFGIVYLQDQFVDLAGLRIWGSPWQPAFNNWAFNLPRGPALAERWAKIPDRLDVLVTHGPPAGILDVNSDGESCGCADLFDRVVGRDYETAFVSGLDVRPPVRPRLHVFGHIHDGHGVRYEDGTLFVNASICDDWNTVKYGPVVVEIAMG